MKKIILASVVGLVNLVGLSSAAFAGTFKFNCSNGNQKLSLEWPSGSITINKVTSAIVSESDDWSWNLDSPGQKEEIEFLVGKTKQKLKLQSTLLLKEVEEKLDCRNVIYRDLAVEYTFSKKQKDIPQKGVLICQSRIVPTNEHCEIEH